MSQLQVRMMLRWHVFMSHGLRVFICRLLRRLQEAELSDEPTVKQKSKKRKRSEEKEDEEDQPPVCFFLVGFFRFHACLPQKKRKRRAPVAEVPTVENDWITEVLSRPRPTGPPLSENEMKAKLSDFKKAFFEWAAVCHSFSVSPHLIVVYLLLSPRLTQLDCLLSTRCRLSYGTLLPISCWRAL